MPAATVTLKDVDIVRTGTWSAISGVTTIHREDLEAMVEAANDPEVDRGVVKIGHTDPRFDGEPALGWVTNLRVRDGSKAGDAYLVGDLVEVPAKLADIIPKAFARRSAEILWGVRTKGGKRYRAALAGVALLGVQPPAVKGLEDVLALYGAEPARSAESFAHLSAESSDTVVIGEGLDHELVIRAIAALAQATATDAVTILGALGAIAPATDAEKLPPVPGGASDNGPNDDKDDKVPAQEVPRMALDEARINELLGLEDDDAILAKVKELKAETKPADDGDGGEPTKTTEEKTTKTTEEKTTTEPAETPEGAGKPELVTLSAAALKETTDRLAKLEKKDRDETINKAVTTALRSGRIVPADEKAWRDKIELAAKAGQEHLDSTLSLLGSLTPVMPVTELGREDALEVQGDEAAWDKWEADVFGTPATTETGGK